MRVKLLDSVMGSQKTEIEIIEILVEIKQGGREDKIDSIRYHIKEGGSAYAHSEKQNLFAFKISATNAENRRTHDIISCTGLIHLDDNRFGNNEQIKKKV